jgi:hypothetical protein
MDSKNANARNSSIEFLFERKHWKRILKSIRPSLRLKIEELYEFTEPQVWFAEGKYNLSLGLDKDNYYFEKLTSQEVEELDEALANGTICLIRELQIGPKGISIRGVQVYEDEELSESISESPIECGFVYLIRNQELYKVGITSNLLKRMEQLKPDEALNVIKCRNFRELERQIHRTFKECRIPQTEYFRFTPEQILLVNKMMHELAEMHF